MCFESQRLEKQMKHLESQILEFPKGKLICVRNGKRWKWFHSDGHTSVYIPKKNKNFAEQLAKKKYLSLLYEDMRHEKAAIDCYLRHHKKSKAEALLLNEPEYQKLLSPSFQPFSQEVKDWINAPYETNQKYPEHKIFKTSSGTMVRSKSEVLIDMALYTHGIPYRYECALNLGTMMIYPDFTIKHPKTGKIYYWEHFGRMDDENYAKTAADKLKRYIENGIIPNVNLIITFETKECPLDYEAIEKLIKEYFE